MEMHCVHIQVHSIISELLFPSEGSDERIVGPYIPTFYQFFDTISHSALAEVRNPVLDPSTPNPGLSVNLTPFNPCLPITPYLLNPFVSWSV